MGCKRRAVEAVEAMLSLTKSESPGTSEMLYFTQIGAADRVSPAASIGGKA
jgi:hypothetical protein